MCWLEGFSKITAPLTSMLRMSLSTGSSDNSTLTAVVVVVVVVEENSTKAGVPPGLEQKNMACQQEKSVIYGIMHCLVHKSLFRFEL